MPSLGSDLRFLSVATLRESLRACEPLTLVRFAMLFVQQRDIKQDGLVSHVMKSFDCQRPTRS